MTYTKGDRNPFGFGYDCPESKMGLMRLKIVAIAIFVLLVLLVVTLFVYVKLKGNRFIVQEQIPYSQLSQIPHMNARQPNTNCLFANEEYGFRYYCETDFDIDYPSSSLNLVSNALTQMGSPEAKAYTGNDTRLFGQHGKNFEFVLQSWEGDRWRLSRSDPILTIDCALYVICYISTYK